MHVITGTHAITKNHMGNKMQHAFTNDLNNKIYNAFNDEWKHHWVSYLNTFDKRINIDEIHLKHLHVYEQIGCNKHNTNLRVEITNNGSVLSGDLIDIDDGNACCDMIALYMEKWNNKCDKIIIRFYHSYYNVYDSDCGFPTVVDDLRQLSGKCRCKHHAHA